MPSRKYEKLNDKRWLEEHYFEKGLSSKEIALLVGAKNHNSVIQALNRLGLKQRTISESLTHNRVDDGLVLDWEVVDGCLLGDGFLRSWNKRSDTSFPYFSKRNKYRDHVEFVAQQLLPSSWQERVETKREGKHQVTILRTLSHEELLVAYRTWYPERNGFRKTVPEQVEMTPKVLLHWFLDDGNSYRRKRKTRQVIITFCSESFQKEEQEFLCGRMESRFGLRPALRKCAFGTGWRIVLRQSETDRFFEIIGPPPVKSLAYKWK